MCLKCITRVTCKTAIWRREPPQRQTRTLLRNAKTIRFCESPVKICDEIACRRVDNQLIFRKTFSEKRISIAYAGPVIFYTRTYVCNARNTAKRKQCEFLPHEHTVTRIIRVIETMTKDLRFHTQCSDLYSPQLWDGINFALENDAVCWTCTILWIF